MVSATDRDSLEGRVLSGTYRVEARLGAGGMGAVYAARHLRTGKPYAVKVLLPELAERRSALDRFRREAHALAALGHANIVQIHDFDETPDGLAFLVMERLEGEDLATRLTRGPLRYEVALSLADQIASALEAAHGIGLVHRDLKPGNVFLARVPGASERAVLLDFGLAKNLADPTSGPLTSAGVVLGTPQYMSPEQAQGAAVDARADIWALGAILHELLCGEPPFEGPTLIALLTRILTSPAPSLRARGVVVSDALESLLQRALSKSPAERFPDATSFRRALHAAGSGMHAALPPATPSPPGTRVLPAGLPVGSPIATPVHDALATAGARRPSPSSSRAPSRVVWAALAGIGALVVLGGAAAVGLALVVAQSERPAGPEALAPESVFDGPPRPSPPASPEPVSPEPAAFSVAMRGDAPEPLDRGAVREAPRSAEPETPPQSPTGAEPGVAASEPATSAAATPEPTTSARSGRRRARADAARAPEGPTSRATSSGAPIPPSFDTSAPGAAERIAARQHIQSGDWAGCVRALRGAPATREVLWARASCAFQARDRAELERACAALDQRFGGSPQASGCRGMMQATAYQ